MPKVTTINLLKNSVVIKRSFNNRMSYLLNKKKKNSGKEKIISFSQLRKSVRDIIYDNKYDNENF